MLTNPTREGAPSIGPVPKKLPPTFSRYLDLQNLRKIGANSQLKSAQTIAPLM